jgi:hypothetical protein
MKVRYAASLFIACYLCTFSTPGQSAADEPALSACWKVDDIRAGMKGTGKTVIKGTNVQEFAAEVLGVLKNTSPGRDLILCRLSGLDLEKTGVIAGMSGSPVYIQGKLVGAVAYAWPFGKEPIAGITPFCQMERYAHIMDKTGEKSNPVHQTNLSHPFDVDGQRINKVSVSSSFADPRSAFADGMFLMPLKTPLAATGFTEESLAILREKLSVHGMVPMQGGGVSAKVAAEEMDTPLVAGGALTVALIMGDFDLSGIGTVTHIEGKRVYGWGHPFMSLGNCDIPLMTGYVHTIYPRQDLSFKMGSPLRTVGVISADVSTCIAGYLDREPDMLPVQMTVLRDIAQQSKTFRVKIVRQPSLLPSLVYTALTNSVDMEGDLPEELTAHFKATIHIKGQKPIVIEDTFSGSLYSGGRAPRAIYNQISEVLSKLLYNTHEALRIESIECTTLIKKGRTSADIEAIELDSERYRPGETVKATVFVRPHKGSLQRIAVELKLPGNLAEGTYQLKFCNGSESALRDVQDSPTLNNPHDLAQVLESLKLRHAGKRTDLVLRIPLEGVGVAVNGKSLPKLPPSMVQIFSDSRKTGSQSINGAVVSQRPTAWVLQGSETIPIQVSHGKKTLTLP